MRTSLRIVQVGPTPVLLSAADGGRFRLRVENQGNSTVYVGDANVSASLGMNLATKSVLMFDLSHDAWYAVSSSGTDAVLVAETFNP
jgi:hypothetical protein